MRVAGLASCFGRENGGLRGKIRPTRSEEVFRMMRGGGMISDGGASEVTCGIEGMRVEAGPAT
jgi:hypothetical protein